MNLKSTRRQIGKQVKSRLRRLRKMNLMIKRISIEKLEEISILDMQTCMKKQITHETKVEVLEKVEAKIMDKRMT
jgi:hypothetical protein